MVYLCSVCVRKSHFRASNFFAEPAQQKDCVSHQFVQASSSVAKHRRNQFRFNCATFQPFYCTSQEYRLSVIFASILVFLFFKKIISLLLVHFHNFDDFTLQRKLQVTLHAHVVVLLHSRMESGVGGDNHPWDTPMESMCVCVCVVDIALISV